MRITDKQKMYDLHVGYNDCPIATHYVGYIGIYDGKWYLTTKIKDNTMYCYTIPEKYIDILAKYLNS